MKILCKICQQVFDPADFGCDDEFMCPVMQLEILDEDAELPENKPKEEKGKRGYQAPSDSPIRIKQ